MRADVSSRRFDEVERPCPWTRALVEVRLRYRAMALMVMFTVGLTVARNVVGISG
jgi:hypothetical protein